MTLEKKLVKESENQLKDLQRVADKYSADLAVYCQFTFDVLGGEEMTNRQIAQFLIAKDLLTPELKAN